MKAFKLAVCATVVSAVMGLSAPVFASQAWERQNDNAQSFGHQYRAPEMKKKMECEKKDKKCAHHHHHHHHKDMKKEDMKKK